MAKSKKNAKKLEGKSRNVEFENDGETLTITVNLKAKRWESASGKSEMIATTGGNIDVGDGITVGLNVYTPA